MSLREAEGPPLVKGGENTREKQQAGGEGSGTERREPAGGSSSAARRAQAACWLQHGGGVWLIPSAHSG